MTQSAAILVERLGRANAERLVRLTGGTRVHVPGRLASAGRLTDLLGYDLAVLVVLHFGDTRLAVPLSLDGPGGPRKKLNLRKLKRLENEGLSASAIARKLGCSERTVHDKRAARRARTKSTINTEGN